MYKITIFDSHWNEVCSPDETFETISAIDDYMDLKWPDMVYSTRFA